MGKSQSTILRAIQPTKPKKKRGNPEYVIQRDYFKAVFLHQATIPEMAWVNASMNGMYTDYRTAALSKAAGMRKGIWDVHVPFPRLNHSCLYIEFKAGKNELTAEQIQFAQDCSKFTRGWLAPLFLVYYNWGDAFEATKWFIEGDARHIPAHVLAARPNIGLYTVEITTNF